MCKYQSKFGQFDHLKVKQNRVVLSEEAVKHYYKLF